MRPTSTACTWRSRPRSAGSPPTDDLKYLREVLTPTSAMIDCLPLASERHVLVAGQRVELQPVLRDLQPDGQTVGPHAADDFQQPRSQADLRSGQSRTIRRCLTTSRIKDDPRPLLLGEYFFPVCHEQTDVRIDPGPARVLSGSAIAIPDSAFGRQCAESFTKPFLKPCIPPGAWSHIVHSHRVMGGAIWAGLRRGVLLSRRHPRRLCLAPRFLGTHRRLAAAQARVVAGEDDLLARLAARATGRTTARSRAEFGCRRESLLVHRSQRADVLVGDGGQQGPCAGRGAAAIQGPGGRSHSLGHAGGREAGPEGA